MEDRNNFRKGVDGQPEPEHLCRAAEACSQFVQLEVWELEMAEGAFVQDLRMFASTSQPGDDGGLSVAEDPLGGGRVQPFGQRRQHHCDLVRRGFQTVQGSVVSSTEGGAAGLTAEGLDPLSMAMFAIANQSMNVSVCDTRIRAPGVRAGKALRVKPLRCSSATFHLTPGAYRH